MDNFPPAQSWILVYGLHFNACQLHQGHRGPSKPLAAFCVLRGLRFAAAAETTLHLSGSFLLPASQLSGNRSALVLLFHG